MIHAQGKSSLAATAPARAAQIALARSWQAESATTGPKVHILTPPTDANRDPRALSIPVRTAMC